MLLVTNARRLRLRSRIRAKAEVLSRLDMLLRRRIATARPAFVH